MKKILVAAAFFLLSLVFIAIPFESSAAIQILFRGNFPITTAQGFQNDPAIAVNPGNSEFLVVWQDGESVGGEFIVRIFGQMVAADNSEEPLIGGNFDIAVGDNPAVAYNSHLNEFMVVYGRTCCGIFGQRVAVNGALIGGEFPVFTSLSQENPTIAYNPLSQQYLVVWGASAGEVHGRLITDKGAPASDAVLFSPGLVGAGNPAVAFNSNTNQYLVVWDAFASPFFPASITDVFGQLVNADGNFVGSYFQLTTGDEIQAFPSVAFNPLNNRYFVAWTDNRNSLGGDIFGQLVASDGSLINGNVPVSVSLFNEWEPKVSYTDFTNQYVVVWVGQPSSGGPPIDVFGMQVGSDGNPQGEAFQVSFSGQVGSSSALAFNPDSHLFLCAWADERNYSTSDDDIFGQFITTQFFKDMIYHQWSEDYIRLLVMYGITVGCGNGNFCPFSDVTRAEMSVFIIKSMVAAGLLPPNFTYSPKPYFRDVLSGHWAFKYVQKMKELEITAGCGNRNYCPASSLTTGQMAVFFIRALYGQDPVCAGDVLCSDTPPYFTDVPSSYVFFKYIQKMNEMRLTPGCSASQYCPNNTMNRETMAIFLTTAFLHYP